MILRIWHGATSTENAAKYEALLKEVVFPGIAEKKVKGYKGIQLLKSVHPHKVEFITIMGFDHLQAVKEFAGEDYEKSYVIEDAKRLLQDYDAKATHYELVVNNLRF